MTGNGTGDLLDQFPWRQQGPSGNAEVVLTPATPKRRNGRRRPPPVPSTRCRITAWECAPSDWEEAAAG
jgi:hypothetical protein